MEGAVKGVTWIPPWQDAPVVLEHQWGHYMVTIWALGIILNTFPLLV